MKPILFFIFSLFAASASAVTCVCAPSSKSYLDEIAFEKCIGNQPSAFENLVGNSINCSSHDLSTVEQTMCDAQDSLERAEDASASACRLLSTVQLVDLILLVEGHQIGMGSFDSKMNCRLALNESEDCR